LRVRSPYGKKATRPCRCGHLDNPALACTRAPRCARDYQGRISGPLLDRIDLQVEVPALRPGEIAAPAPGEARAAVAARVARAREIQAERFSARTSGAGRAGPEIARSMSAIRTNAEADGALLDAIATPDAAGGYGRIWGMRWEAAYPR
jgi:magnesium chelatase family protein